MPSQYNFVKWFFSKLNEKEKLTQKGVITGIFTAIFFSIKNTVIPKELIKFTPDMCTLTYIPKGNNDYILTQNRDESPRRSAPGLLSQRHGKHLLLFPQDSGAGGTWISASDKNQFVAILNGAFIKHKHQPPYRRSRGLMALDFFAFANATHFFRQYVFEGMEPFTMVIFQNGNLYEFRWDEKDKHVQTFDASIPHLWASSTLYPPAIQEKRQTWFRNWLPEQSEITVDTVLDFHQKAGDGDPTNDLVMNRNNIVCTTSITSIAKSNDQIDMLFHDLIRGKTEADQIKLSNEQLAAL